jgi:hypothetical protein
LRNEDNVPKYFFPKPFRFFLQVSLAERATAATRVARWFVFKPKIPIWVNFGGPMLVYFMVIWNILRSLCIFYDHLVMFWKIGMFPFFGILCQEKSGIPGGNTGPQKNASHDLISGTGQATTCRQNLF